MSREVEDFRHLDLKHLRRLIDARDSHQIASYLESLLIDLPEDVRHTCWVGIHQGLMSYLCPTIEAEARRAIEESIRRRNACMDL